MARKATGTIGLRGGRYFARVRTVIDGKVVRPWIDLETTDEGVARARMIALAAQGAEQRRSLPAPEPVPRGQTFEAYALDWLDARRARGVAMVESESSALKRHVFPYSGSKRNPEMRFGDRALADITPKIVRGLLVAVAAKGLSNQTIKHVRATIGRILDQAWRDDEIPANPVLRVKAPLKANEVRKQRAVLTDAEFEQYMASNAADPELQMMGLVSRCEGGMRTIDVNSWGYEMLDLVTFASCFVPRTKSGVPQRLEIPELLRERLRARWEAAGCPERGPIFPVRRGPRKGQAKKRRGVSYARALRRDLRKAGLRRRELFVETPVSKPVDFHSFRRAFGTRAGEVLTERHAMALGGWESSQAFGRYVAASPRLQHIPPSILPSLDSVNRSDSDAASGSNSGAGHGIRTRDPQLGKLTGTSDFGVDPAERGSFDLATDGQDLDPADAAALSACGHALLVARFQWDLLDSFLLDADPDDVLLDGGVAAVRVGAP